MVGFVVKSNDHPLGFPRRCDRPIFELIYVKSTVELESGISFSIPAVPVYVRVLSGAEHEKEKNQDSVVLFGVRISVDINFAVLISTDSRIPQE
jgi:hypothetical protein